MQEKDIFVTIRVPKNISLFQLLNILGPLGLSIPNSSFAQFAVQVPEKKYILVSGEQGKNELVEMH